MINQAMMGSLGGGAAFYDEASAETITVTVGNDGVVSERGLKVGSFGSRTPTTYDGVSLTEFFSTDDTDVQVTLASAVNGSKGIVINRTGSANWWYFDHDGGGNYSLSASSPDTAAGMEFVFTLFNTLPTNFTFYKIN